jgi:hypothetical protein
MRRWLVGWALAVTLGGLTPATGADLDKVVARHVEAKGGRAAWDAVTSMKVTGTFRAFSKEAPFTLQRKRERMYHMDHVQNGRMIVIGFDGEQAWWDNHWLQEGAQPITQEPDLHALMREIPMATDLFDYADRGARAKLVEESEVEGIPAIAIELTWPDETVDTWYLDPETHLELARQSPGSDFGQPMPMLTFFDDFRAVGGVQIPHRVESQWYTRDRVMTVEQVQLNIELEDELFRMPAPTGMGPFVGLAGKWKVKMETRQQPGAPWQESTRDAEVESRLGGAMLGESFTTGSGGEYIWTLSYDRFKKLYRYTQINNSTTHLDVREGDFDDDGKLMLTNVGTGTVWEGFGMTFHTRITLFDLGASEFKTHTEISTDGGENWFLAAKQEYTRPAE